MQYMMLMVIGNHVYVLCQYRYHYLLLLCVKLYLPNNLKSTTPIILESIIYRAITILCYALSYDCSPMAIDHIDLNDINFNPNTNICNWFNYPQNVLSLRYYVNNSCSSSVEWIYKSTWSTVTQAPTQIIPTLHQQLRSMNINKLKSIVM